MLEYARWKYVVAALILVIATIWSLPNLYPQDAAVQITASRGGTVDAALRERAQGVLEAQKIPFKRIDIEDNDLLVRLADSNQQIRAADALRTEMGEGYVVALNLASTVPDWLSAIGARPMLLGLDLQGGVHFLMEVDQKAALEKRENGFAEDIRVLLRENDVRYTAVNRTPTGIVVQLHNAAERDAASGVITSNLPQLQILDGTDGASLTATV